MFGRARNHGKSWQNIVRHPLAVSSIFANLVFLRSGPLWDFCYCIFNMPLSIGLWQLFGTLFSLQGMLSISKSTLHSDRSWNIKPRITRAIFYSRWQCNFKKLLRCSRKYKLLWVACLAPTMQQLLKSCKILKTPNSLAIYLLANFATALCSQVAFFPRDGNAAITGEKLLV